VTIQDELFLLAVGMVNFLVVLLGLTAFLSIARQVRLWMGYRPSSATESPIPRVVNDDTHPSLPVVPAMLVKDAEPTRPSEATRRELRAMLRGAVSNPVTLSIEPEAGPSQQQRTVQRLIAYLKEESTKAATPASTA
jgi:hypothetical protein